jgi:cobalt-zinc-cadmium efflux system membrane fusion protein
VAARWEVLNPANAKGGAGGGAAPDSGPGARAPSDPTKWCFEHGVPDAVCTRCNAELIAKFQAENDWCAEHGLPESQCTLCHREVREKWAALRPESDPRAGAAATDLKLERRPRLLTATSDPLCQVDSLRVRFLDPSVVHKSGIEVEAVRPRRISAAIDVPAEVEFDATRVTRVTPRVAGIVQEVTAELGDIVQAGDLLAVMASPELGEAKSQYIERKQTCRLAEADLERVQTIYQGQQRMLESVTGDATTEEIRQRLEGVPVGEAKARLLRAHAELQLARAEEAREAKLSEKQISSERDYETARSELAAGEAAFLAIREEIAFSSEREQIAAERAWQTARTALEAAERQLHILGLSDEQVQAIGAEPDTQLSRYELRSPVSGRIVELGVATGEAVEASDVLFVAADNSSMWLLADVYERDLLLLREGAPVLFTVDGLPGVSFEGHLKWISSQVDDRTRTVRVRANLPNEDGLLRAKMFGLARLVVHDEDNVLSVAADAVQTDGCCQLVFVQEDETVFAPRKVVLGASANGHVEVLKGLAEGELVATTGSFLMKTEILKGNIGAGCCEVDPGR